jgi:site-specific DNA-methyltransferase (adenine-specific)
MRPSSPGPNAVGRHPESVVDVPPLRVLRGGSSRRGVAMNPYYDDGTVTIYHGSCEEVMPHLDPVDIVVTSPPYNMGLVPGGNGRGMYRPGASNKAGRFRDGYDGTNDDAMPQDEYDAFHRARLGEMWTLAQLGVFYNHRPRIEHGRLRVPLGWDYGDAVLRQIIVWDRGTGIDVTLRGFCTRQEWIMLFAKPEFRVVDHSASGMGDVWRLGIETTETGHPAPFPISLPARCISATGAHSVLDPFLGSGTTLRAAKDAGVRGIGIERSEAYCEIAAKRLAQEALDFRSGQ